MTDSIACPVCGKRAILVHELATEEYPADEYYVCNECEIEWYSPAQFQDMTDKVVQLLETGMIDINEKYKNLNQNEQKNN